MQLPQSKTRQAYIDQVKTVEEKLKAATASGKNQTLLSQVQNEIDRLAEKYQYDKEIGKAVYKLYELQALAHYFNGEDNDALDFINQAIETRGDNYARAEKLKAQLLAKNHKPKSIEPSKMTKAERRKQKIGLEGWLALFTVGSVLSVILYAIAAVLWFHNLGNLSNTADDFAANLLSPYYSFLMITSLIMAGVAAWLVFLLFKHRRMARWIGITLLGLSILISFADYMWYADLLTKIDGIDPQKGDASIGYSIIWIIYLCVSKRVKRTLTK
jgi:hypothetical protein